MGKSTYFLKLCIIVGPQCLIRVKQVGGAHGLQHARKQMCQIPLPSYGTLATFKSTALFVLFKLAPYWRTQLSIVFVCSCVNQK